MDKDMDSIAARWAIVARRALLGAAVLVMASQTALANPITLICDINQVGALGPATIDMDEAHSSVSINMPANQHVPGAAQTIGPTPAKFTSRTITFSWTRPSEWTMYFTINRLTGSVTQHVTFAKGQYNTAWDCHVGKAKF